eukprot:6854914-Ditylum_brightwellii.AAC.1
MKEGHHYLGSLIGSKELATDYVTEKVDEWVETIKTFSTIMPNNLQAAFAGYACSLQFEWFYLQRTIKVKEQIYKPVEDVIKKIPPQLFLK